MGVGVGELLECGLQCLCGVFVGGDLVDDVRLLVALKMEKSSHSKFIIFVSMEGLESFGVDTPISLLAIERQDAFREITD